MWRSVGAIICSAERPILTDPHYTCFACFRRHFSVPQDVRDRVVADTTWDPHMGYRFWHKIQGPARDQIGWFANSATRHVLYQVLVNDQSGYSINVPELSVRQGPGDDSDIVFVDTNIQSSFEKIVFVLSWVSSFPHFTPVRRSITRIY